MTVKKVAILGFSDLPQSESVQVYEFYKAKGAEITAFYWDEPKLPADIIGIQIKKSDYLEQLSEYDIAVRGPAVHPRQIPEDVKTTSLINLFFEHCPTRNIIGVTGTKGKGTTSTLVAKILENAGHKVWLGGNIGRPLLGEIDSITPEDWVVLELSAGQLIDAQYSPNIAVCLMVIPEHLDWHTDLQEYEESKGNIFRYQREGDTAVYFGQDEVSTRLASRSKGQKIPFYSAPGARIRDDGMIIIGANDELLSASEVKLLGKHNLQNVCAAITATWDVINANPKPVAKAVKNFSGLPHRIEFLTEKNGLRYYNDSFATGLNATEAALDAIDGIKVVIIGGFDRNLDVSEFARSIGKRNDIRKVLLIGASASRVAKELRSASYTNFEENPELDSMKKIVEHATQLAETGDAIVLSPGFASFDMFKNFEERGNKYRQAVDAL